MLGNFLQFFLAHDRIEGGNIVSAVLEYDGVIFQSEVSLKQPVFIFLQTQYLEENHQRCQALLSVDYDLAVGEVISCVRSLSAFEYNRPQKVRFLRFSYKLHVRKESVPLIIVPHISPLIKRNLQKPGTIKNSVDKYFASFHCSIYLSFLPASGLIVLLYIFVCLVEQFLILDLIFYHDNAPNRLHFVKST